MLNHPEAIIVYLIVSVVYQMCSLTYGYFSLKKKFKTNPQLAMGYAMFKSMPISKVILSPAIIGAIILLAIVVAPLTMPVFLIFDILRPFKKASKQAQQIVDSYDQAKKDSEEFLKTEGAPVEEATSFQPPE